MIDIDNSIFEGEGLQLFGPPDTEDKGSAVQHVYKLFTKW